MITRELGAAPNPTVLLARAALGSLPGLARRADTLPDVALALPPVRVDPDHLAAYARVCGFGVRDELPATYQHVLAFPLALALLTDRAFPFPMIGLVHVRNTITQHRPLLLGERPALRVHTADLRPHERGQQFDVVHEASVDGEPVWRDVSTYLRRGGRPTNPAPAPTPTPPAKPVDAPSEPVDAPSVQWSVAEDTGRRYAAVSGDRNPIHLHALTARPFGFPRAIAHGMWTKARCLAALAGRLPTAYTVDVAFTLPVLLPATVAFSSTDTDTGRRFTLHDARSGKPHLHGTITTA